MFMLIDIFQRALGYLIEKRYPRSKHFVKRTETQTIVFIFSSFFLISYEYLVSDFLLFP